MIKLFVLVVLSGGGERGSDSEIHGQTGARMRWCGKRERDFEAARRAGLGLTRVLDCGYSS